jgi:protein-L-isoaspartate(D-aspartate) O-methyltransferase
LGSKFRFLAKTVSRAFASALQFDSRRGLRLRFVGPCRTTRGVSKGMEGMFDSATARRMMVDGQVLTADVHNPELIAAMLAVPRERFVPAALAEQAYVDGDLEIAKGRSMLRPMVLAKLIQAAHVAPDDRVLDVGCGLGYSSAVLARLAGSVVALEEDVQLARAAKEALAASGAANVVGATGRLTEGWPAAAPYDFILLNGSTEVAPQTLAAQLKPTGRLACISGRAPAAKAMIFRLAEGRLLGRPIFDAAAPVLPGFVAPPAFVF